MRRLYALRPTRSFTQRVQAITQHQPRSAGILDDLREISRLALTGAAPMTAADRGHFNYANRIQRPMDETVLLGNDTMDVTKLTQAPVRSAEESDESEDSSVDDVVEYYRMAWGAVEVDGDAEGVVSARRLAAAVTALNAAKSPDAVDIGEQDTGAAGTA